MKPWLLVKAGNTHQPIWVAADASWTIDINQALRYETEEEALTAQAELAKLNPKFPSTNPYQIKRRPR